MSSKIIAGTTSGTALNMSADTSGQLEIQTGSGPTTALTVSSSQIVNFANAPTIAGSSFPSGAWTYLTTVTASGSSTADVENAFTGYDNFAIVGNGIRTYSGPTGLKVILKIGGSYLTSGYYGQTNISNNGTSSYTGTFPASNSEIPLSDSAQPVDSQPANFVMYISSPADTALWKSIYWNGVTGLRNSSGFGANNGTSALTGVRFYYASGTIYGTFRLYGIKNS